MQPQTAFPNTPLSSLTLRGRLTVLSMISTITLALIISLIGSLYSTTYLRDQIGKGFEVRAQRLIERLDREIFGRWREVQVIAAGQTFANPDVSLEDRRALLDAMISSNPMFSWIGFATLDGVVQVSTDGLLEGEDVSARPWFIAAKQAPYVGDLHEAVLLEKLLPRSSNEPLRFLDVAAPVYYEGEVVGVLGAHLGWPALSDFIRNFNTDDNNLTPRNPTDVFILSGDGYVIMDSLPKDPSRRIPYPFTQTDLVALTVNGARSGVVRWEDGQTYVVGIGRSTGYGDFPGLGYSMLLRQPEAAALLPARNLQLVLIIAGGSLALIFVILNRFAVRVLLAPLHQLTELLLNIRDGKREAEIPISPTQDEVGVLSKAFHEVFATLKKRNADLATLNIELEKRVEERTTVVERRARELANEIATRKQLELALTESRESFRRLAETGLDGIAVSVDGVIIYSNKALIDLFGYEQYELVRMSENEFVAPESRHIVQDIFALGDYRLHEVIGIRKSGERFPMEVSGRVTRYSGAIARVMTMRDISNRKRTEAEIQMLYTLSQKRLEDVQKLNETLEYRSSHDHLTNLANRQALEHHLQHVLSEAPARGRGVAVIFIDLDHFKEVNDMYGHSVGDLLLQLVANRMRESAEEHGLLARMGGDEFALVVPMVQRRAEASDIAQTLLKAVSEQPYNLRGREVKITASIGISFYPEHGHTVENLLRKADIALYTAKDQGRNTYRQAEESAELDLLAQMQLEIDLRDALSRHQLEVHYQPQFTLHDDRIMGFEALLRWNHPTLGRIPPARFIPVAEATDLILSIGAWVLQQATQQAKRWHDLGYMVNVSVNVSPRQFESSNFVQTVRDALSSSGIRPSCLELEVTEGLLMRDIESKATILEALADYGVRIAIDDFGTGFSSLTYLQKLPINTLKIDRSFIADIRDDNPSAKSTATAIIRAVSQMAHSLGIMVVAEGVETELQLSVLRLLEADALQGYLLGRPMPVADVQKLLVERSKPDQRLD